MSTLSEITPAENDGPKRQSLSAQFNRGGHALRKLKDYCDKLYAQNQRYQHELEETRGKVHILEEEKRNLEDEIHRKNDRIARTRQRELRDQQSTRIQDDLQQRLLDESRARRKAEIENQSLRKTMDQLSLGNERLKSQAESANSQIKAQEEVLEAQKSRLVTLEQLVRELNFKVDELKVALVKLQRRNESLELNVTTLTQKNEQLAQMETTFREENSQLQRRLRELLDANKEVTSNYQAIKKHHDLKRSEFEDLTNELEEAKNACQLAIRQRKQLQVETGNLIKQRQELQDKAKNLEATLARKENDISDLLTKVNETINDYEQKLEKKEEQMWAMSIQMSEDTQKQRNTVNIDPDFINDIEKKWQAKERNLQGELEVLTKKLMAKEEEIQNMKSSISELHKNQYQPRMERLKTIEKDIKGRMEEFALGEERMETGFLCPRHLGIFRRPQTFSPCGHTFCESCVNEIRDENYNKLKCSVCGSRVEHVYRNLQLESLGEQFARRKTLTLSFLEWIKFLRVHLPTD